MESLNSINDISEYTQEKKILWNVQIEILTACNFSCVHCYIPNRSSKGIALKKIEELSNAFFEMGAFNITLTGGEIFLRDDIFEIIKAFRKVGLKVSLYSNGSILDREKCGKLRDLGIHQFSTTIFSLEPEINDAITCRKNSLRTILLNLSLLEEYGIPIQVKMPIMKMNYKSYAALKQFCHERNYSFFPSPNITPKTDGDFSPLNFELEDKEFAEVIRDIEIDNIRDEVEFQNVFKADDIICHALNNSIFIDSAGDVFPCISWRVKLGNIYEKSIDEIWSSSEALKHLRSLKKSNMKYCGTCEYSPHCTICPGDSMLDGDMFGCSSLQKKCAKSIMGLI